MYTRLSCLAVAALLVSVPLANAQSALSGDAIHVSRTTGPISIDGELSDEGWRNATRIDRWYEANPGDNVEPQVRNVGYLTYDDRFFYAGFEFDDPDLKAIRAPFADRDNIGNGFNDYGGIIIDPRNTGRTATFFVVTRATSSTTRSPTMRRARTRRPISSGNRRPRSPRAAGRSRSGFRFRRCATRISIRRPGASCCIATFRATATISSSPRSCRAAATASSAARTR